MSRLLKRLALFAVASDIRVSENPVNRFLELSYLRQLLKRLEIDCVLDVGANQGQFAAELREIGFGGQIVSFEPISREFGVLQNRFRSDSKWQGFPYALGREDKQTSMNVFSNLTVMSSLLAPVGKQKGIEVQEIEVRRLDGVLPDVLSKLPGARVFLKMDTQGYDLEVFEGARGVLGQVLGLQSEISVHPLYQGMPHYLEALSVYESAGFDLSNLTIVSRTPASALQEMNCFMQRRA